jgi:hypothetical protein
VGNYKAVIIQGRYWRGQPHRWTSVYPYVGTAALSGTTIVSALATQQQKVGWGASTEGVIAEVSLYDEAIGGVPVETNTWCDPKDPGTWSSGVAYTGSAYALTGSHIMEPVAESAVLLEWAGGFSRTGKPVRFRKFIHAIPNSLADVGADDLSAGSITGLTAAANGFTTLLSAHGLQMGWGGRLAGAASVSPYYANHQMPRGRRRKS